MTGTGELAGGLTVSLAGTATALADGVLTGTSTIDVTPTATALGAGALAGIAVLTLVPTGTLPVAVIPSAIISGTVRVQLAVESVRVQTIASEIRVFLPRAA
jgi:hypothetical protein